jgi:hypothetical protein
VGARVALWAGVADEDAGVVTSIIEAERKGSRNSSTAPAGSQLHTLNRRTSNRYPASVNLSGPVTVTRRRPATFLDSAASRS